MFTKAKNLRAAAEICLKQHGGRVPHTLEEANMTIYIYIYIYRERERDIYI